MKPIDRAIHAVNVLNRAYEADPHAMQKLVNHRVVCNKQLAEDETIQVGIREHTQDYEVGLIGIINGICGIDRDGWGHVAAIVGEDQKTVKGFKIIRADKCTT